jgi:hypothetical protein
MSTRFGRREGRQVQQNRGQEQAVIEPLHAYADPDELDHLRVHAHVENAMPRQAP